MSQPCRQSLFSLFLLPLLVLLILLLILLPFLTTAALVGISFVEVTLETALIYIVKHTITYSGFYPEINREWNEALARTEARGSTAEGRVLGEGAASPSPPARGLWSAASSPSGILGGILENLKLGAT